MKNFKDVLQHSLCTELSFTGEHQMPRVNSYLGELPKELIAFNRARALKKDAGAGIHFYIRDTFFECLWKCPSRYLELFKRFHCVVSTDFSVYADMTMPEVIWNSFRNKLLAAWLQKNGVPVIPNVSWAREWSFNFCFEGFPKHSVIAINSTGIRSDKYSKDLWIKGYEKVLEILEPKQIVRYGAKQNGENESISIYYPNDNFKSAGYGR